MTKIEKENIVVVNDGENDIYQDRKKERFSGLKWIYLV